MANTLTGYEFLTTLYESSKTIVYRGCRETDRTSVIVKTHKSEYPSLDEITRLNHEYEIIQPLDIAGVVKPYELKNHQHSLALILEDFPGLTLKQFIATHNITLSEFITIAIHLAQTLGELHSQHIIHKNLKPDNILINPNSKEIKLIDFSISSRLEKENPTVSNPNFLEGTLAYMSPEQTGRMNRSLDYRTDFYSLGITFYEILTGNVPFNSIDPMELVHCHIAKIPVLPCQDTVCRITTKVPEAISAIVMKLLAKTAEDRYQSAFGLKADLEECWQQLQSTGKIENFVLGKLDKFGQFQIPQKLYGRENEVAQILAAFERITAIDNPESKIEMVLVSGYSGIGKTSVVNEVHRPIVGVRGYFIAGKYDQFKRNIPYAALIQAFQELVRQLLTESPEQIAIWKEKIQAQLGNNGQVITEVIPEIELIIGKQPAVPNLGANEAQNRFIQTFKQFIQIFTAKEHPLVLFLDDLQWVDLASLKLIQLLTTDINSKYLLLLGAYRDNEVNSTHPLILTVQEIENTGVKINNIILRPLGFSQVWQLVSDTLGETDYYSCSVNRDVYSLRTKPLAELLYNKTQGNPFFLTQLFKTLYSERLLTFNFKKSRWLWDITKIQAIGITDVNVVSLVARNIQKLSASTQIVLKLAACIGNTFDLDTLAIVNRQSILNTASDLWEALQVGLILPLSEAYKIPLAVGLRSTIVNDLLTNNNQKTTISYKFLHDRVQQAAYSLIPEDTKQATHLEIGYLLLQNTYIEEKIFDIVNQINFGINLITDQQELYRIAQLNLHAGRKAIIATAYAAAAKYLAVGIQILATDGWQRKYELMLTLHEAATEAEFLNNNLEKAQYLAEIVLQTATNLLDKVKVYELKVQFHLAQNQVQAAVDTAQQILAMLGVSLSETLPSNLVIQDLFNLPEMTDEYKLAAMRILMCVVDASAGFPSLFRVIVLTMVNLCLEYGNSYLSAYTFAVYSWLLCGALEDIEAGYQYSQLALYLTDKYTVKELKCKIYELFNAFVRHWKEPAKTTIQPLKNQIQECLEVGNREYACFAAMHYCSYIVLVGEPLEEVAQKQLIYIEMMTEMQRELQLNYTCVWHQLVLNLMGQSANKYLLVGEKFDETTVLPELQAKNSSFSIFSIYVAKLILSYLLKDYQQAVISAQAAISHEVKAGLLTTGVHNFYYSLTLLGLCHQEEALRDRYLAQVAKNQEKMQYWAKHAPANYQHKYDLVEAEKARILGQNWEAAQLYDRAIDGAAEQEFLQEEALANELAAEFYLALDQLKIAAVYMQDACYCYLKWGATVKVKDLEERYPNLLKKKPKLNTKTNIQTSSTVSITNKLSISSALDLTTVMKASQSIASEIVLDKLLAALMKILIENAGAQKGFLILPEAEELMIVASLSLEAEDVIVKQSIPVNSSQNLPITVVNYVQRTLTDVVLTYAAVEGRFISDPYISSNNLKSVLCVPILNQRQLIAILYLENNLTVGAFTADRLEVLKMLSSQAAISLENALLYTSLERKVQERTQQLNEKNLHLEQALHELQNTQAQLIQAEKMSGLGQMVAGIAHEINNPANFIFGNIAHANDYVQDLFNLISVYQQEYPNPTERIEETIENIDLDFLAGDLKKLLNSMQEGTKRIRNIVLSLRTFSRLDEADKKAVDINEGIESTLLILQHRLVTNKRQAEIEVIREYGQLPLVNCYASQLNQVFMNAINNAIDAIAQVEDNDGSFKPWIRVGTEVTDSNSVKIKIADNGIGMTPEVQKNIFNPFFTTKPVGSGTGLGLSVSYQIVVEKHGGQISCTSVPSQGTEFVIEIPN